MSQSSNYTKDLVLNSKSKNTRIPLYNPEAIKAVEKEFNKWKKDKVSQKDKENWTVTPHTVIGSEMERELLYTPLSNPDFDYMADLGNSGQQPFTRGLHSNMYRGRQFTMRQLTGFGGPKDTNERIKFMLDKGATGLSILFDLPTIQMYDSDDPISRGQVGMSGVAIDSVDDMELLFKDIPIEDITISLVTHYPSNTAILFPMFLAMAKRRGISWDRLKGSVQNDVTLEEVVRSGPEYIPPRDCFRIQCDNIEFIRENVPGWNFITLNGYNLREFGASGITEIATAITNGMETIDELISRGYEVDWIGRRLAFFWSAASDFFDEVSRIRAARRLWYKIIKNKYNAKDLKSTWMRCHVQTSGISLTRQEPLNNVIRAAFHALSVVFGGAQSLHVDSYDEAYSVPTEESALLSLRTQQIIQNETAVTEVVDPLGGSYYIEALTSDIETRILDEIDILERAGGYISSIEKGIIQKRITDHFYKEQEMIEKKQIKLVGQNIFNSENPAPPIDVFEYPEGVEEKQKERITDLKSKRSKKEVEKNLQELEQACIRKENIIPFSVRCAEAGCTVGEIFKVFKKSYGLWKPPVMY
jgi:methylmalonyl-CoA mutase, N-terminal domain